MHSTIMNAINQFYPDNPLELGIVNEDIERYNPFIIYNKEGNGLSRENGHLIWIDTSKIIPKLDRTELHKRGSSAKYETS